MDPVERVRVRAREEGAEVEREDALAVEEPLEIRIGSEDGGPVSSFVTTMRTPGNDEELAAGLLFAEGVLEDRSDLRGVERPADPRIDPELKANVLIATLEPAAFDRAAKLRRGTVMGSACGVCGKTSIENVIPSDRPPLTCSFTVSPELLYELPKRLRERQSLFARTGGLHAAGLFSSAGALQEVREDIGRHNATDKLVGALPAPGRASPLRPDPPRLRPGRFRDRPEGVRGRHPGRGLRLRPIESRGRPGRDRRRHPRRVSSRPAVQRLRERGAHHEEHAFGDLIKLRTNGRQTLKNRLTVLDKTETKF